MTDRTEQEAWEDAELVPLMPADARRWFLQERENRKPTPPAPPAAPKHAGLATIRGPAVDPEA